MSKLVKMKIGNLMKFVKFGFLELSIGAKNPLRSVTSKIVVLAKQSQTIQKKIRFFYFAGVKILRGSMTNGWAPYH